MNRPYLHSEREVECRMLGSQNAEGAKGAESAKFHNREGKEGNLCGLRVLGALCVEEPLALAHLLRRMRCLATAVIILVTRPGRAERQIISRYDPSPETIS